MAVVGSLPNLISVPALRLHVLPEPDAVAPAATIATDHHSYNPSLYGPGAEHALLCRESSILLNCTQVADSYDALATGGSTAPRSYKVASLPTLSGTDAASADSPMRVIPVDETRTVKELNVAMDFRAFLHANDVRQARTGHLPVRRR